MNRYAAALGLADTHYANPIGLDQRGNHSSARDLATLTRRLLRIPAFARIAASRSAVLRSVRPPRRIESINELLRDGALGDRGEDRPHLRRPLRPGRLGPPQGGRADLRRDRRADRRRPLSRQPRPARVRLLAVPAAGADPGGPGLAEPLDPLRRRRAAAARRAHRRGRRCGAGQRLDVAVRAPGEVEGPIRRGAALGTATVSVDGPARRLPWRCGPGARCPRRALSTGRASFVRGAILSGLPCRMSAILIAGAFLVEAPIRDDPHRHPQRRDRPHRRGAELPPRPPPPRGREPHRRGRQGHQRRPRAEPARAAR